MQYVMSIERIAMQDGVEQGIEQGSLRTARENVLDILALRFQSIPAELVKRIDELADLEKLKTLLRCTATAGTLEEVEQAVETVQKSTAA